jgi:hypothetical protein
MNNDLEKYLKDKREHLDIEKPDQMAIWEGIRSELDEQKKLTGEDKRKFLYRWNVAAVIIMMLGLAYIISIQNRNIPAENMITLSSLDKSLGEREKEYQSYILVKKQELGSDEFSNDPIIKELQTEIIRLDTLYNQSINDLNELGYNDKIIQTIFNIYEQKIFLLKLMILETNKKKSHENKYLL